MDKAKPFIISKQEVFRAYELTKKNKSAAGIDDMSWKEFDKDLKKNLYKLWNRMSSGTYFPPLVKAIAIPKKTGGERILGIPTISDRIAQKVVKMNLESLIEPLFNPNSFGYRPYKSAHQAVEQAKNNCWTCNWGIDLDIKGFFDNLNHTLLMKMVKRHTDCAWVILYIERWLKTSMQMPDGSIVARVKGTPQGGVISPLLANLYLHYAFDLWMTKEANDIKFERYADDIIIHCRFLGQAKELKEKLKKRFELFGLELHPEKTKIFYCEDDKRNWGEGYATSFDFLGFTFKKRTARGHQGKLFMGFQPGMSMAARRKISQTIRIWHLGRRGDLSIEEISRDYNAVIRGWVNYYGKFYKKAFSPIRCQFNVALTRWAMRRFGARYSKKRNQASKFIYKLVQTQPELFAFWSEFYSGGNNG